MPSPPVRKAGILPGHRDGRIALRVGDSTSKPIDEDMLRRSFDVARRALAGGNHPFGAILVGPDGGVLIESENGYLPGRDVKAWSRDP